MKRVRGLTKISFLTAVLTMVMFSLSFAVDIQKTPRRTVTLPTQVDLSINAIWASDCKCDLSDVDALYMGGITVDFGKRDISTPAVARTEPSRVVGTISVTYHDLLAGRPVTQTKMIQNFSFTGGAGSIRVVSRPVLIKKSVGVKAEIELNSPGYAQIDPNAANNTMTKKECEIMLH
jgi:hypothetical protein